MMLSPIPKTQSTLTKVARICNYYVSATLAYGFTRAMTYRHENSKRYYNETSRCEEVKPMLFTDQIGRVLWHSWAAIFGWPVMLGQDLRSLECHVRGKDPKEYAKARV